MKVEFQSSDGASHPFWECPLCLAELTPEDFCELNACGHRACITCFQQYLRVEITESRVCISCPECLEPMHPNGTLKLAQFLKSGVTNLFFQRLRVF